MDQEQPASHLHAPILSDGLESLDHVADQLCEGSVVRQSPRAFAASRCNNECRCGTSRVTGLPSNMSDQSLVLALKKDG
jgi:hypothetical protein